VLILTPTPLVTAAERAFFAELAGWDTGSAVRGGLMAALPVVEGPMQRRQADALLFVPEGLAVVRVVEVERRSGVVTANPDGAWTIGDGEGPGDVVQLAGGGSTPLEGLMRAGMHAAVTLRKAGLEPGRIARLTVLTGAVTGLRPADGDLGEGDQVTLVDSRSLLLGIGRAARYAGTDNPRIWTTADVRAAVEALGVAGRSPSVEELNGEGFPYSPYVLRRQELLTPAALNASPTRNAVVSPPTAGGSTSAALDQVGPLVDPAAAARVAAAAVQAQEEAERAVPAAAAEPAADRPAARTVVPAPAPAAAPHQPTVPVERRAPQPSDTLALTVEPVAQAGLVGPRSAGDDTGGLGGLFADGGTVAAAPVRPRELPPELRPRARAENSPPPRGSTAVGGGPDAPPRRRTELLIAALLLVVVLAAGAFWLTTRNPGGGTDDPSSATSSPAAAPTSAAGLAVGATEVVDGTTFTLESAQEDGSCQGHAYDAVAEFFGRSDCTALSRSLWSAGTGGQPAVVAVSRVTMPDAGSAQALLALADTDGSGNVNDLLREGVRYEGGPTKLSSAQYDSAVEGTTVTIVETSWVATAGATSALDALAAEALSLPVVG